MLIAMIFQAHHSGKVYVNEARLHFVGGGEDSQHRELHWKPRLVPYRQSLDLHRNQVKLPARANCVLCRNALQGSNLHL